MVKKKKPKLLEELQNIILSKGNLINVPQNNIELNKKYKKTYSDFDCIIHKCDNIIPEDNLLNFEDISPNKDNMFKTIKHTLYPNEIQRKILLDYCDAHIEMYNHTIKKIKDERKIQQFENNKHNLRYCDMTYKPNIGELKKYFSDEKEELSEKYTVNKHILDYAINDCISMFKSIRSNQISKNIYHSKMRYLKKSKRFKVFKVEKMICSDNSFCSSVLGKNLNIVPPLNYKNECEKVYTIQYDSKNNKFLLLRRVRIEQKDIESRYNSISIDLGLRTLITGISENHILEIGTTIHKKLRKKHKKIEKIKELNETLKECTNKKGEEFIKRTINNNKMKRKILKIENKISNYVDDTQWKISNFLTKKYNHIVIGDFSTSNMKKNRGEEKTKNLQIMKDLNMFKFREKIKYKCLINKRKYIKVNEAYTTKCCVNCSEFNDIKDSKIYNCSRCHCVYDRDIKSAGCIYLKALI